MTPLALKVLSGNETPSLYGTPCPCCKAPIGVGTTLKKRNRSGGGWRIRYLKCKACGYIPPDGSNKWVTVEGESDA